MAEASSILHVTVIHATPEGVWQQRCLLPPGATVGEALDASGFATAFPGLDPQAHGLGIFGVRRPPGFPLHDGDRVEVYRALVFDPMESRRRRAAHKARQSRAPRT